MKNRRRTAVITGGTGALGSVVATAFLDKGAHIAIPYHSDRSLAAIPSGWTKAPDQVMLMKADITLESDVQKFCAQAVERFGGIDYLLNIAGGYAGGSTIAETSLEEWERMLDLNLKTAFLMSRQVLPIMMGAHFGRIVNITSKQAVLPGAKAGAYAVAKRGIVTLTEILADEVKGTGITVNALAPSVILTDANRQAMNESDFSRWVSPEELTTLILHICSDESKSVNGNIVKVFGGG
ncbi:MAG: SDR family oxidoreductase [Ignavibacteria bacterium]|nr:SDR family oxidoreductase [Ignavibacteria bacterium]